MFLVFQVLEDFITVWGHKLRPLWRCRDNCLRLIISAWRSRSRPRTRIVGCEASRGLGHIVELSVIGN